MLKRRTFLALPLAGALASRFAWASGTDYPSRTIRLIVPASPGAATDNAARFIASELSKVWSEAAIVENRTGASGNIATDYVARANNDGHTLILTYSLHYTNALIQKTTYDPVADFEPIARLSSSALVVLTGAESRFKTIQDVIDEAKKNPGSITYASSGVGTTSHMCAALFEHLAGIKLHHTPYSGSAQAATDAAGGIVDLTFNGTSTALPLVQANRLHALAVTSAQRSNQFADVPTMAEAGVEGYDLSSPMWILAPKGTPKDVVNKLSDAITKIALSPGYKELCDKLSLTVDVQDTDTYRASIPEEIEKWKMVVELTQS